MRVTITLLSYDHGILRQVLDVVQDMAAGATFDQHRDIMPEVADFFLRFMDGYHHGKEERFVFPVAADAPDRIKAMVPDLIADHRKARSFANAIAADVASWNLKPLAQNCLDLVAHMREHIIEEEDFVFPALENVMDSDKDLTLFEQAQTFVRNDFGEDYPSRMEAFANRLQEQVWGKGVIKYPISR
jgi:hemerythrin-like domain-containing protein